MFINVFTYVFIHHTQTYIPNFLMSVRLCANLDAAMFLTREFTDAVDILELFRDDICAARVSTVDPFPCGVFGSLSGSSIPRILLSRFVTTLCSTDNSCSFSLSNLSHFLSQFL